MPTTIGQMLSETIKKIPYAFSPKASPNTGTDPVIQANAVKKMASMTPLPGLSDNIKKKKKNNVPRS